MGGNKKKIIGRRMAGALLAMLLPLLFSMSLRAQVTTDVCKGDTNCGKLGAFANPLSVTVSAQQCTYTRLQIDLTSGTVWVQPDKVLAGTACPSQTLTDGTTLTPPLTLASLFTGGTLPTGPPFFPEGVFEVTDFNLLQPVLGATTAALTLEFLTNADNTPIIIRSNGATGVTINAGTTLSVAGKSGGETSGSGNLLRGVGGAGGNGGYRGGDGGNGGISPTVGQSGFGPAGGLGGAIGAIAGAAKFFTTGMTLPTTVNNTIPISTTGGPDLLTQLRGGSGGGGGGGTANGGSGRGGGGGGGAILIAANNTIKVDGTITAQGGITDLNCVGVNTTNGQKPGSPGTGGVIRLVAATITGAGSGVLTAAAGTPYTGCGYGGPNGVGSDNGLLRLEAFNITGPGVLTGSMMGASAPGQILIPGTSASTSNPFVRFARIKDAIISTNCVSLDPADTPCTTFSATPQTRTGRTGVITSPDATMPNSGAVAGTVNIDFIVGPIPGFPASPTNTNITLVVTPLDPAQGVAKNYQAAISLVTDTIFCPSSACKTSLTGVTLPLGFSSMTAFVVLNLTSAGTLARMFPKMYEGEVIENVRLETTGDDTKYVLIAKSGKEFPYQPQ